MGGMVFALSLFMMEPGTPIPEVPLEEWGVIQKGLWAAADNMELMDQREQSFIFRFRDSFIVDVNLIRSRYQDLKNAPKISEGFWLPAINYASEGMIFNDAFARQVEIKKNLETDRTQLYEQILKENRHLRCVWDAVRDSKMDAYYLTTRRLALKRLKDLIGVNNFYSGYLPPCVPIWRFRERD